MAVHDKPRKGLIQQEIVTYERGKNNTIIRSISTRRYTSDLDNGFQDVLSVEPLDNKRINKDYRDVDYE